MITLKELTNHFFQPALLEKHSTTLRWYYFDNQFVYLTDEAIEDLRKKLRNHESRLAKMFETKVERDSQYSKEHYSLMEDATKLS